jgi:AcrR family transcriptional regulator
MAHQTDSYHHGDLRRMLISTAEEIIASQGLEAFSLRQLSKRIGVSHTAAYRHFKSKHELFCALALEGFKELEARFQKIDPKDRLTPREQISAIGKAYIGFAMENPALYRVMFGHVLLNQERTPELRQAGIHAFNHLRRAIERGQDLDAVRDGDASELTILGWSMVHGISQLLIDGQLAIIKRGQAAPALIAGSDSLAGQEAQRLIDIAVQTMTAGLLSATND